MELENIRSISWIYNLYRLGHAAIEADSTEIYRDILRHIVTGFGATSGCLALREDNSNTLTIVAGIDIPAKAIGAEVQFGEGVLGHVANEGEPLLLNGDISNDPRFKTRKARTESKTPLSAMCWPLNVEDRVIGVLSINKNTGDPFDLKHLQQGSVVINLASIVIENAKLHATAQGLIRQLQDAHNQLLQSEKMASIGQLAAGIAHEINNPIGFINSNLGSLKKYVESILGIVIEYEKWDALLPESAVAELRKLKASADLEFIKEDTLSLLSESRDGIARVCKIVHDLKDFSHVDESDWQEADLHKGLDSTLNIANNEVKYKADVIKQYGELSLVECLPSQINQVFMNMFVNAAQAMETHGKIIISTMQRDDEVCVKIADTGRGIPQEHLNRIFDPFFTTKPVGEGTGLGLSLSYGIVNKHKGRIEVDSVVGKGTTFHIWLPIKQPAEGKEGAVNVNAA
jgi:two-component system, NtrC family, sensor kinase